MCVLILSPIWWPNVTSVVIPVKFYLVETFFGPYQILKKCFENLKTPVVLCECRFRCRIRVRDRKYSWKYSRKTITPMEWTDNDRNTSVCVCDSTGAGMRNLLYSLTDMPVLHTSLKHRSRKQETCDFREIETWSVVELLCVCVSVFKQ